MTIGESLKRERNKQDLSLDDVAKSTKIAKIFLIALENDDISSLPKGIYARNFLRTYASFLGMDVDIVTAEYHDQFGVKPHFVSLQEQNKRDDAEFRRERRKRRIALGFVILVVAVAVYLAIEHSDRWLALSGLDRPDAAAQAETLEDTAFDGGENFDPLGEPIQATDAESGTGTEPPVEATPVPPQEPVVSQEAERDEGDGVTAPVPEDVSAAADDRQNEAPGLAGESAPPETDAPPLANEDEGASSGEEPAPSEADPETPLQPRVLPISDLSGLEVLPLDATPGGLHRIFAVEALGPVLVRVVIDGEIVTERTLIQGQARIYQYGRFNALSISDISRVALQDGSAFRPRVASDSREVTLSSFNSGELMSAIDAVLAQPPLSEEPRQ